MRIFQRVRENSLKCVVIHIFASKNSTCTIKCIFKNGRKQIAKSQLKMSANICKLGLSYYLQCHLYRKPTAVDL